MLVMTLVFSAVFESHHMHMSCCIKFGVGAVESDGFPSSEVAPVFQIP